MRITLKLLLWMYDKNFARIRRYEGRLKKLWELEEKLSKQIMEY